MKLPKESAETSPPITPEQLAPSYLKPWEDLTIADDYMFKLVMSHKHICKHLLEMILGIKIRKLMEPATSSAPSRFSTASDIYIPLGTSASKTRRSCWMTVPRKSFSAPKANLGM